MNVKRTFGTFLTALLLLSGCISDEDSYTQGVWERRSDLDGAARAYACSFTIDNKGYLFGGYKSGTGTRNLKDLWIYNIEGNYWSEGAPLPDGGSERHAAVAFTINGKGYITTGLVSATSKYLKDTWEYDPATNNWTQMDDFPGTARYGAFGFVINDYGYVGGGKDENNYMKDIYRFDPTAPSGSQWQIINGYGGSKRMYGTTFVINNIAYICCGENNGSSGTVNDLWKFDGTTWTQLRDISNTSDYDYDDDYAIVRSRAIAFVIDDKAYLVGGNSAGDGSNYSDYWIYDPVNDLWSGDSDDEYTPFAGSSRTGMASFSTGTRGFVVGGISSSLTYDDTWELLPYELEND